MKIEVLTLYSSNLKGQKHFYTEVLGFELLEEEEEVCFALKIGQTTLTFVYREGVPIYHFAFNIPSNQGAIALDWLKERVKILDFQGEDLVGFEDWNAEAMYFYDADKNIVEFIARKNLEDNSEVNFTAANVLEVSEMGVPTDNVAVLCESIRKKFPIEIYSGDLTRFCAAGDERGLFIIIDLAVKKWIPRNDEALAAPFKVLLSFEEQQFEFVYENGLFT